MLGFPVKPRTKGQLIELTNAEGGEAIPWTYYDTASYVTTVTTALPFFNATRANQQATNLQSPGQLQSDQFFQIYYWGANIILSPDLAGFSTWQNLFRLLMGGTSGPPTFTFTLSNKNYGPFPLSFFPSSGGLTGAGAAGAAGAFSYANNGYPGSAVECWDGAVIIPPQQNFGVTLNWDTAQDVGADRLIQVWMKGTLYRRVV